jgi:hypothetical protein
VISTQPDAKVHSTLKFSNQQDGCQNMTDHLEFDVSFITLLQRCVQIAVTESFIERITFVSVEVCARFK